MQIVERIKEICKQKGTTMGTLEKELGLGNGSIRRWDTKTPGADKILLIANRLEVSTDWLLTGNAPKEITADEKKLVELYRNTNEIGQPLTIKHAEDIQKALPRTNTSSPESSASKIG